MSEKQIAKIPGRKSGERVESRLLEEEIQQAVSRGYRRLEIDASGQHGIGGRLWSAGDDPIHVTVLGTSGQRLGSLGFPNTVIETHGPVSDDVGWLNAGAKIIVHGNASNGVANGMAQGQIYIAGSIGARGMTMTKHNPRFDPPELWILGSAGDYFGEFMAGGRAVICGIEPQNPHNVFGYRPLVGMVGGKVFVRGPHEGYSQADAKQIPIGAEDWQWLSRNLKLYLESIHRPELVASLTDSSQWQLFAARTPQEKFSRPVKSMSEFHRAVWEQELGTGGLIGDLSGIDRSPIGLVPTGALRRYVPVWEDRKYAAPCQANCPTGIPVQERWRLVREGRIDEAIDLALAYTPFPASVCGYLCPHPCMNACTRQNAGMQAIDIEQLGRASLEAELPELPAPSGKTVAVIGGGPAGISVAWQLRQQGHIATVYDTSEELGGKLSRLIPRSRIPEKVLSAELNRIRSALPHVHLQQHLTQADLLQLKEDFDFIVVAVGAQKPRLLPVPGKERLISSVDFLSRARTGDPKPGKRIVIIGAGNVGCDVAAEAGRFGAQEITLLDVQEPASFGKERKAAEAAGAVFRWPVFVQEVIAEGVRLTTGETIAADTVVVSIGDAPDTDFLPPDLERENGYLRVDENFQTNDPKIFAIGDVVKPGLLTDAIGAGKRVAAVISEILAGKRPSVTVQPVIDRERVTLEYFDPRITRYGDMTHCGSQCSSCGACRDCGICIAICPENAISKVEHPGDRYEYRVDPERCIGCGFCGQACPCGVWNLVENDPLM